MSNPTGEALSKAETIAAHQAAIIEAEGLCIELGKKAAQTITYEHHDKELAPLLIRAGRAIKHLLPLHKEMISTSQFNMTASEALQKTVDYRNKTE